MEQLVEPWVSTILQVDYPLSKMPEIRSVLNLGVFLILEYLHVHSELSWGWDPSQTSLMFYKYLRVILYNIFSKLCFDFNL
jgi:hypothetical protein